jgi:broad specificity phosphatase PhoE
MPTEIVMIRHAQSTGNAADRASLNGDHSLFTKEIREMQSPDWPLTNIGMTQSKRAGDWVRNNIASEFDLYLSSNYRRSVQTSELLGFVSAKWKIDPLLRERSWGGLENLPYPERNAAFEKAGMPPLENSLEWKPVGGESMNEVILMLKSFISRSAASIRGKRILIVTHGGPMHGFRFLQRRLAPSQYIPFCSRVGYIRNCHIFHYYSKRNESDEIPLFDFERSVFVDGNNKIIDATDRIG